MKITKSQLKRIIKESIGTLSDPKIESMKQIVQDELDTWLQDDQTDYDVVSNIGPLRDLLEEINAANSFNDALKAFKTAFKAEKKLESEWEDHTAMTAFNNMLPKISRLIRR